MKDLSKCRRIDAIQARSLMIGGQVTGDQLAWAIFEDPAVDPTTFIARPFLVAGGYDSTPMPVYLAAATLAELRQLLPPRLTLVTSSEPEFLEVWMP